MLFNTNDVKQLKASIDLYHTLYIAQNIGTEALTKAEKRLLTKAGHSPSHLKGGVDYITYAFHFGGVESSLRDGEVLKKLTFAKYKEFMATGAHGIKLSRAHAKIVARLKQRAAGDVRRLSDTMKKEFADIMADVSATQRLYIERMLRKKMKGKDITPYLQERLLTKLTKTTQKLMRRFEVITAYNMHAAYTHGIGVALLDSRGKNVQVYFRVHPDACPICKKTYLKYDGGPSKIFYLKTVIGNGSNIGKKGSYIKASLDPLHPHCRCKMCLYPGKPNRWDKATRSYVRAFK